MRRRTFLLATATAPGLALVGPRPAIAQIEAGDGPYGALASTPDANGILLPEGFSSRVLATSGEVVPGTEYTWHTFPDGGATFDTDGGGWIYVSNAEVGIGNSGVGALAFGPDGEITDAYSICEGTSRNCAGGATPWGTWLTCEEVEGGKVLECDPRGELDPVVLPLLGAFIHEAVAVDPDAKALYLTEDAPDGRLYRFTPENYPGLASGVLDVARVDDGGSVTWLPVPDPSAAQTTTRLQVPESTAFSGGEGIWYREGVVWFVTKGDGGVWKLDVAAQTIEAIYKAADGEVVLNAPDNIAMTATGDLLVCEDQSEDQQLVLITPSGVVAPILQLTGQSGSELAGVAFNPAGDRLYVSSQRGGSGGGGVTYEITGPFREPEPPPTTTTETTVSATTAAIATTRVPAAGASDDDDGGMSPIVPIGIGGALAAAVGYGAYRLRTRRPTSSPPLE